MAVREGLLELAEWGEDGGAGEEASWSGETEE